VMPKTTCVAARNPKILAPRLPASLFKFPLIQWAEAGLMARSMTRTAIVAAL
jgi:hypothetical protein